MEERRMGKKKIVMLGLNITAEGDGKLMELVI